MSAGLLPPLSAAEFAADFPDDEIIVYRHHLLGYECLILVPKAKLEQLRREGKLMPFWRHGETINVRAPSGGGVQASIGPGAWS